MSGANANFRIRDLAFHAEAAALTGNGNITDAPEPLPAGYGDLTAPANSLTWRNIPYASFRVFAFSSETETDPANAVAYSAIIAPLANDFWSAANTTQNARVVFDVDTLNLPAGTFWLRIQALSEQNNPINNLTPARNWGEDSPVSTEFAQVTVILPTLPMTAVQNPAGMSRATGWDHVEGAASYIMYVFDCRDAANEATVATAAELAVASAAFPATGERIVTDMRMITFTELNNSGAVRTLPAGFTPAGLGASAPAAGSDRGLNTTNLRPGQYLIRVVAVPADATVNAPSMSAIPAAGATASWFNIAMGPDELRAYIESRIDDVGTTLRIVCVRNNTEARDEGWLWGTDVAFAGNVGGITPHEANLLAPVGGDTARRGEITLVVY